jgi:hypothetical protein
MDNEWSTNRTLDLTVILHGTTQTRCIILSKATDNAQPSISALVRWAPENKL